MEDITARRGKFNQLGSIYPKQASVKTGHVIINGVSCYWLTPEKPAPNKIVIHLHGGAFAVGSIQSHESMLTHFAHKLQTKVLFVDYALAPELPYPNALNDVMNVYTALIAQYPGYKVDFIGDSAGAGLIVSAVGEILKKHIQLPNAAVFISPWISLHCDNPSHEDNRAIDPILSREYLKSSAKDYIGNIPIEIVSPENVELSAFPPVLIMVGTNEILQDDSINFYNSIKAIQPAAKLSIYENQVHVWMLTGMPSAASQQALTEIKEFLN
ncbi:Acetyl esterase/lipase [Mucilaginibacter mallensis]|uniref:Acetyl esterase/lipase n=1 Tax=Mucilaginibacter mallensis TaxID=652787 RepID=A0A1H2CBV9_MUCMA|nr:alpha/beta hydrolase [Mucilaginibacter mallensis]SDT67732.1 Acetyl esterase/lipase [Mucilaginibacter mallensis]